MKIEFSKGGVKVRIGWYNVDGQGTIDPGGLSFVVFNLFLPNPNFY